jgi:hypothetical protein
VHLSGTSREHEGPCGVAKHASCIAQEAVQSGQKGVTIILFLARHGVRKRLNKRMTTIHTALHNADFSSTISIYYQGNAEIRVEDLRFVCRYVCVCMCGSVVVYWCGCRSEDEGGSESGLSRE